MKQLLLKLLTLTSIVCISPLLSAQDKPANPGLSEAALKLLPKDGEEVKYSYRELTYSGGFNSVTGLYTVEGTEVPGVYVAIYNDGGTYYTKLFTPAIINCRPKNKIKTHITEEKGHISFELPVIYETCPITKVFINLDPSKEGRVGYKQADGSYRYSKPKGLLRLP